MIQEKYLIERKTIIETARMLKDKNVGYKLGAKALPPKIPKELDCSGFVRYCYHFAKISVPDGSWHQWHTSRPIDKSELELADLGFLYDPNKNTDINHIGLYAGDGKWIHCNASTKGISLDEGKVFKYYRRFTNIDEVKKDSGKPVGDLNWIITVSEKEKAYAVDAIYQLANLGYITNPKVHINNFNKNPENWAQWVVLASIAKDYTVK